MAFLSRDFLWITLFSESRALRAQVMRAKPEPMAKHEIERGPSRGLCIDFENYKLKLCNLLYISKIILFGT